jgi:hypothetical protein
MNRKFRENEDTLVVEEIQSFLQEKRTDLKIIRIGIAVVLAQISAVGLLVRAFRNHAFIQAMNWMDILVSLGAILLGTAIYLFVGPLIRIHRVNRKIVEFRRIHNKMVDLTSYRKSAAGDHEACIDGKSLSAAIEIDGHKADDRN